MRWVFVGAVMLACVFACALSASARQLPEAHAQLDEDGRWVNGVTESWWPGDGIAEADAAAAAARWKEIGDELARDGAAGSAGDYFLGGDTSGTYMRWSPRAGFVIAAVNKCEASVRAITYGKVRATQTLVEFFPEVRKVSPRQRDGEGEERKAAATPEVIRFVPVGWRGEHMLIPEDAMDDFGDYLSGLGRYNGHPVMVYDDEYSNFLTRFEARRGPAGPDESADSAAEDSDAADSGKPASYAPPVVPPGYERFLKKPVEATVTAVGRRSVKRDYNLESPNNSVVYESASITRVTIGAGTAQGVKDRMVFSVVEPREDALVFVLRAGENESEAIVVRELYDGGAETFRDHAKDRDKRHPAVSAGWKLTTNPF